MTTVESMHPVVSPKTLRVMHVIPQLGTGGAEKLVSSLVRWSQHPQVVSTVVSLYARSNTPVEHELETAGIDVRYLDKRAGLDTSMIVKLQRLMRLWRPDIVHSHLYAAKYAVAAAWLSRLPTPVVHTCHSQALHELPAVDRAVQRLALRMSRIVIVGISQDVSQSLRETYGLDAVPTILNGVELTRFGSATRTCSNSDLVYCEVGNFSPQKGHEYLIRAFAQVHEQLPDSTLLLAGDGPLLEPMRELAQELQLGSSVVFLGSVTDVSALLAKSDVFVLPSIWEGLSLALVEAQASGLPAVVSAVGGIPEVVKDGLNGLLVPPATVDELAAAMLALGRDRDLRRHMGQAARDSSRRFDIATTRAAYESLYRDVLGGKLHETVISKAR